MTSIPARRRWPFFLWVLFLGLLYFAGISTLRIYGALASWQLLSALEGQPGPLYLVVTGAVFAVLFTAAAFGLFARTTRSLWLVRGAALLYALWYWVDRLFISQAQERFTGWPFSLGLTAVLLGLVYSATAVLAEMNRSVPD